MNNLLPKIKGKTLVISAKPTKEMFKDLHNLYDRKRSMKKNNPITSFLHWIFEVLTWIGRGL